MIVHMGDREQHGELVLIVKTYDFILSYGGVPSGRAARPEPRVPSALRLQQSRTRPAFGPGHTPTRIRLGTYDTPGGQHYLRGADPGLGWAGPQRGRGALHPWGL